MEKPEIILLGGGSHAKVVYDILRPKGYCSFFDDNPTPPLKYTTCFQRGSLQDLVTGQIEVSKEAYFVCTIGDNATRMKVVTSIQEHYPENKWWTVIDDSAKIAESAEVKEGSMIMAHAVVQSHATIGKHCIINTGAIIEHDNDIEDFVHVAPSATICGRGYLEEGVFLGTGAKVIPDVYIQAWSVIGAGVVVLDSVPSHVTLTDTWKKQPLPALSAPSHLHPAWVPRKQVDMQVVQDLLYNSFARNHFANNGPAVQALEAYVRKLLRIHDSKALIAVSNATAGIHAVVDAWGGGNNFVTQAFTFPASAQGPLQHVQIVDMDVAANGPNLNQIEGRPAGLIVTNVFGHVCNIDLYTKYAQETGCKLLFDNAATPWSFWNGENACNFGNASVISFHHTKPLGFGEGGMIIIDRADEAMVRRIINFGYDVPKGDEQYMPTGNNYKMSDVSAAFIMAHLKANAIRSRKLHQDRFQDLQNSFAIRPSTRGRLRFFTDSLDEFLSCFAVLFPKPVPLQFFQQFQLYVRKYYKPLSLDRQKYPVAWDLYDRIICFPCHAELTAKDLERYVEACHQYLSMVMVGEK